jgi:hypothetical protein
VAGREPTPTRSPTCHAVTPSPTAATTSVRADLDPERTAGFVINAWEGTLIEARTTRSTDAFDSFFTIVFGTLLT